MAKNEHEQETEHEVFEFAGKKLLKSGTSGPHKLPTQVAQGTPVRHDLTVAGRSMMSAGTSGPHSLSIAGTNRPSGPGKYWTAAGCDCKLSEGLYLRAR